jgi:hypothetical protein
MTGEADDRHVPYETSRSRASRSEGHGDRGESLPTKPCQTRILPNILSTRDIAQQSSDAHRIERLRFALDESLNGRGRVRDTLE